VVTISRLQVRNALTAAMIAELRAAFGELDRSDALRVGVLTGDGGHFGSGRDLRAFAAGEMGANAGADLAALVQHLPAKSRLRP
jgi:enoyl-CoA hydratase